MNNVLDCNLVVDPSLPSRYDHGLYLAGQNEIVVDNLIASNAMHGIQLSGESSPAPTGTVIYNNTIMLNRRGGGIMLDGGMSTIDIANNLLYGNGTLANPPSSIRDSDIDSGA